MNRPMRRLLIQLIISGLAGTAYAADMESLAVTAPELKAEAPFTLTPDLRTPAIKESPELTKVKKILGFGGGIRQEDKAFMNKWFPKFFAKGLIGRAPTKFEKSMVAEYWFTKLAKKDYWRITAEACDNYNCVSWGLGITGDWIDPGNTAENFEKIAWEYGYLPLNPGESEKQAELAYWEDAGEPTHICRRVAGDIWESKVGSSVRILHRLKDLEDSVYGHVAKLYRRAKPEELAALGATPKEPDGNGIDPCGAGKVTKSFDGTYNIGSPYAVRRR